MKHSKRIFGLCTLLFGLLMSLPWLVPHMGWTILVAWVPLLVMERLASEYHLRRFFWWHYACFVLWNALTTWWVGGATVVGAIFAILANAFQMSVIFESFRWVKRRTFGVLPYLYLAAAWISWEKMYLSIAQISWPWLVLGNAFADTTSLVQWYSVLGTLGGSLWVWTTNLSLFGLMVALSRGSIGGWRPLARISAFASLVLAFFGPMIWSFGLGKFQEEGKPLHVVSGQPNFDPYEKKGGFTQEQQDAQYLALLEKRDWTSDEPVLVLAPETFVRGLYLNQMEINPSLLRFRSFLRSYPQATLIFGASTWEPREQYASPHPCAYDLGALPDGRHQWVLAHNTALLMDTTGCHQMYHKTKLVVGTELTPHPKFFVPLEKRLFGGPLMGKDIGQKEISCLYMQHPKLGLLPIGVPVCYESVYGEFCTGYVKKGAQLLAVITNDAWWGDTPGYKQHLNYSRLRAIETRRWVARCANTGISAFIDPRGNILSRTSWWEPAVLEGDVQLLQGQTFFVRYGDLVGRIAVFVFVLLLLAAFVPRRGE